MTNARRSILIVGILLTLSLLFAGANAQSVATSKTSPPVFAAFQAGTALSLSNAQLIYPEELVKTLKTPKGEKPLILQIGPRVLYDQAHIPGSEYIAAGSSEAGKQQLRKRVQSLPHGKFIVLYCGCCPWSHCPNVAPAYQQLNAMGFTNVKALYIANNFGADWVDKGYPVAKGN